MTDKITITINGKKRRVDLPPEVVTVTEDGTRATWTRDGERYRATGKRSATLDELGKRYDQVRWDAYAAEVAARFR